MSGKESYFVIHVQEGVSLWQLTKEELLAKLDENYWGDEALFLESGPHAGNAHHMDLMEERGTIIIKGEMVTPFSAEKVIKHNIK